MENPRESGVKEIIVACWYHVSSIESSDDFNWKRLSISPVSDAVIPLSS